MNCSLLNNIEKSSNDISDNDESGNINTACLSESNEIRDPLWTRDRVTCVESAPTKVSLYNKSDFIRGQETKKERFSRLSKKTVLQNENKLLANCNLTDKEVIKTGVCIVKTGCNVAKNTLTNKNLLSLSSNSLRSCGAYKKGVRRKIACK